jgi:hypothetical protein
MRECKSVRKAWDGMFDRHCLPLSIAHPVLVAYVRLSVRSREASSRGPDSEYQGHGPSASYIILHSTFQIIVQVVSMMVGGFEEAGG